MKSAGKGQDTWGGFFFLTPYALARARSLNDDDDDGDDDDAYSVLSAESN